MLEQIFEKTNLADVGFIIIASIAIVCFWRGVWGLMDVYLFPGNSTLSFLTSITLGIIVLIGIAFYKGKRK